jgi:hypothetical protein
LAIRRCQAVGDLGQEDVWREKFVNSVFEFVAQANR